MRQLKHVDVVASCSVEPTAGAWALPAALGGPYVLAKSGVAHGVYTWAPKRARRVQTASCVDAPGFMDEDAVDLMLTTKEAFFVRHPDGNKTPIALENMPGTVAEGHEVVLIYGSRTRQGRGTLYGLCNARTGQCVFIKAGLDAIAPNYGFWTFGVAIAAALVTIALIPELSCLAATSGVAALQIPLRIATHVAHYRPLSIALKARAQQLLRAQSASSASRAADARNHGKAARAVGRIGERSATRSP